MNIIINYKLLCLVELKWNKTPKDLVEVAINQELSMECDASGTPEPIIEWTKHSNNNSK